MNVNSNAYFCDVYISAFCLAVFPITQYHIGQYAFYASYHNSCDIASFMVAQAFSAWRLQVLRVHLFGDGALTRSVELVLLLRVRRIRQIVCL